MAKKPVLQNGTLAVVKNGDQRNLVLIIGFVDHFGRSYEIKFLHPHFRGDTRFEDEKNVTEFQFEEPQMATDKLNEVFKSLAANFFSLRFENAQLKATEDRYKRQGAYVKDALEMITKSIPW